MTKRKVKYDELKKFCRSCRVCKLHKTRTKTVFGVGNLDARLIFIGEGPGEDEDKQGKPFVGKAGRLLDKMIQAMGLSRSEVYITNVVKCRPTKKIGKRLGNRAPDDWEMKVCSQKFLNEEISLIKPEVIVTLGRHATCCVFEEDIPIGKVRGEWHNVEGIDVMPTFHPAYLLRDPHQKKNAWKDLQKVMERLKL